MVRITFLLAGTAALLAACDRQPVEPPEQARNAAPAPAAAKPAEPYRGVTPGTMQPGLWEADAEIVDIVFTGGDPKRRRDGDTGKGEVRHWSKCFTPAMVAQPPAEALGSAANGDCTYDRFAIRDGRLDAEATCMAGKMPQKVVITGVLGDTAYAIDQKVTADDKDFGHGEVTIKIDAKRTGDCTE